MLNTTHDFFSNPHAGGWRFTDKENGPLPDSPLDSDCGRRKDQVPFSSLPNDTSPCRSFNHQLISCPCNVSQVRILS